MKKVTLFTCCFLFVSNFLSSSGGGGDSGYQKEYVSFPMMNQEIRNTMNENERQKTLRNKQALNTTTEGANKRQWTKLKETKTKIQNRLKMKRIIS